MIGPAPMCMYCKHYRSDDEDGFRCKAFPKGIPDAIIDSEFDHRKPYAGEKLLYEPVKNAPPLVFDLTPSG